MVLRILGAIILVTALTGCATTKGSSSLSQLQTRVAQLESDLEEQDRDISDLRDSVEDLSSSVDGLASSVRSTNRVSRETGEFSPVELSSSDSKEIIRVSASPEDVQRALKAAGFYTGSIDGKIGSGSQKAIKDFQKEKGMEADGIVGKRTWAELKQYLQ